MCSIFGAISQPNLCPEHNAFFHELLAGVILKSNLRGRDGFGLVTFGLMENKEVLVQPYRTVDTKSGPIMCPLGEADVGRTIIGNFRAEPTTEYVKNKREYDQQPYTVEDWTIVHNGTIANDTKLRTGVHTTTIDSAAIVERLSLNTPHKASIAELADAFNKTIMDLVGSYAILAVNAVYPELVFVACNYRPIWFMESDVGTFFASSQDFFPEDALTGQVKPYSNWIFSSDGRQMIAELLPTSKKALAVCSGGMDSVVAVGKAIADGYDVELLHFHYNSQAEGPETLAVKAIADHYGIPLHFQEMKIYKPEDSPLVRKGAQISSGKVGAEFAVEWVPARNLVMLALATARAEAGGFEFLILGNNMEEAGAYPDNEPEFIAKFNAMLPFAIGANKRLEVLMPVGNLMKHEIVRMGSALNVPLHLTWSCYSGGEHHCGKCGPCYMRQTAFKINGLEDPMIYQQGDDNALSSH
jgi:7-cyano-7-deazaguanine synthase